MESSIPCEQLVINHYNLYKQHWCCNCKLCQNPLNYCLFNESYGNPPEDNIDCKHKICLFLLSIYSQSQTNIRRDMIDYLLTKMPRKIDHIRKELTKPANRNRITGYKLVQPRTPEEIKKKRDKLINDTYDYCVFNSYP
jgi:hypothetical protein